MTAALIGGTIAALGFIGVWVCVKYALKQMF